MSSRNFQATTVVLRAVDPVAISVPRARLASHWSMALARHVHLAFTVKVHRPVLHVSHFRMIHVIISTALQATRLVQHVPRLTRARHALRVTDCTVTAVVLLAVWDSISKQRLRHAAPV